MSSTSTYLPRRSVRIAEKHWSAYFAKYNTYDKENNKNMRLLLVSSIKDNFEEGNDYPDGVINTFSLNCYMIYNLMEYYMTHPIYLVRHPKVLQEAIQNTENNLQKECLRFSKNIWAKKLRDIIHEFITMTSYLHLCK